MEIIFEKNIELIKAFYDSYFYKKELLGNRGMVKKVIEAIYRDPDVMDETLICKAREYTDKFRGRKLDLCFSPDGICGWKILFDVYSANGDEGWIEKYCAIRGSKYGELFFPSKIDKQGHKTINVERNVLLGDRIDMFLYDFKLRIENESTESCKLRYENQYSVQFLNYYRENGFEQYIKDFDLGKFVKKDKDNKIIGVTNIATEDAVTQDEFDSFNWSNRYSIEEKRERMKPYLDNLVKICNGDRKRKLIAC